MNENPKNHWQGKTWYAYGTSMTSVSWGEFVPLVAEFSGLKVINKGIPGGSLTPHGLGKGNVKRAVMNLDDGKKDADLITLEVLPNEGAVVGKLYDTDDVSFCGCFNQAIRYLQANTTAQIVVIVMIGSNTAPPQGKFAGRNIPEFEFAETIERLARMNGVPVINAFCDSGFGYGRVKARDYQKDNIHLNKLGGLNMAKFIWSKLKDIPTWEYSK